MINCPAHLISAGVYSPQVPLQTGPRSFARCVPFHDGAAPVAGGDAVTFGDAPGASVGEFAGPLGPAGRIRVGASDRSVVIFCGLAIKGVGAIAGLLLGGVPFSRGTMAAGPQASSMPAMIKSKGTSMPR